MRSFRLGLYTILIGFILLPVLGIAKEKLIEAKMGDYRGAKTATHPDWFKESFLDLDEDIADATASNKRLILYFWQPGCPYCNQLWEDSLAHKEIEELFRSNFEVVALNMWGDRDVVSVAGKNYTEKTFSNALSIQYTPTLLFFDENKKVVHQLNGYIPPEDFKLSLEFVSNKHEAKQSFGEFSVNQRKPKQVNEQETGKLHNEDFFSQGVLALDNGKDRKQKYLAVFFEGKDCKNCNLLHDKTLKNSLTRSLVKQFESVQFNRYADTQITMPTGEKTTMKIWANKLGISYLPAMLFFDRSGKEVMRIDAQMRTFHIQSVFDYVLTEAYKTEHNFQRYISERADKIRENGIDVDIWAY